MAHNRFVPVPDNPDNPTVLSNAAAIAMNSPIKAIPHDPGMFPFRHTLNFLRDFSGLITKKQAEHGPVFSLGSMRGRMVSLISPDANEFVLLDREKNFASEPAWNMALAKLFPNGLMLRDGSDHAYHRRLMTGPFKSEALSDYTLRMSPDIDASLKEWADREEFLFYPAIKKLTLEIAAKIFLGDSLDEEMEGINKAFADVVAASFTLFQLPIPSTNFSRGLRGRRKLEDYFYSRIDQKRASDDSDMFAEISRAEDEDGNRFSKKEVVDHIIFLMMAAHDTTTSSLSSVVYSLASNPEWQERLAAEVKALNTDAPTFVDLQNFETGSWVLKEALRLYPPLMVIPRRAVKDCEFQGYPIKKGSNVSVFPMFTQRMPEIWTNPETFDPERFSPERAEDKQHRFAWIPFGGGVHKCLGLNFAEIQVKLMLFHFMKNYRLEIRPDYEMPYIATPLGKPSDDLPIKLRRA